MYKPQQPQSSSPDTPQSPPLRPAATGAAGKILGAARELFAERGFAATSTRAIASYAGVNLALIHYYFGNKEQLYRQVIEQELIDLHRIIGEAFGSDSMPEEALPRIPHLALRMHREHPYLMRVLLREIADGGPHLHDILDDLGEVGPRGLRDLLVEQMRRGKERGLANDLDPMHLLAILFSVGNGLQAFAPLIKELFSVDMNDEATHRAVASTVERIFRRALAPGEEV